MTYKAAIDLSRQVKDIDQQYLDDKMEEARANSMEARKKMLVQKVEARQQYKESLKDLKTSLYGF